jgi:hypothetical protein
VRTVDRDGCCQGRSRRSQVGLAAPRMPSAARNSLESPDEAIVVHMVERRMPLSARDGIALEPALREGVPEFAEEAIRQWIFETAGLDENEARHSLIRLGLTLPASYRRRYARELEEAEEEQARLDAEWKARQQARQEAQSKATATVPSLYSEPRRQLATWPTDPYVLFLSEGTDRAILWDIADDLLHALCIEPLPSDTPIWAVGKRSDAKRTKQIVEPLRRLLEESRSVYEIQPSQRGLRRRLDAILAESSDRSAASAVAVGRPRAQHHLTKARDLLYGLHPDPSAAYVEMILAVEEVACPLFLPNDPVPTLGKVRAHLRESSTRYEYVLQGKDHAGSTAGVVAMLTDLWEGHSDRHGGGPECVPVSQQAAEVAFTLAASLVAIFATGAVHVR